MNVGWKCTLIFALCYLPSTHGLFTIKNEYSNLSASSADCADFYNNLGIDRRRVVFLLTPTFPAFLVPSSSYATDKLSNTYVLSENLLEARTQLDLAVQASSVKAWSDALDAANDKVLDESNLKSYFDLYNKNVLNEPGKSQLREEALTAVSKLREELSRNDLSTDNVIAVMKYGTSARNAIDSYFELEMEQKEQSP